MVKTFVANILNLPDPKENPNLLDEFLQDRKEKILSHKNNKYQRKSHHQLYETPNYTRQFLYV